MATAKRESVVKDFLDQRQSRKINTRKPNHPLRGHRQLVTLSEEELSRRELGWNDRFTVDPPPKSNKLQSPAHSPTFSTPPTPLTKESKIRNERVQYGKRGGKRNREPKKPSSGKLVPLGTLSKPPSEAAQPTKEEKLRFKVLKAIDARETLLYQLSALILCTPVQEALFLPSRPTEPPTSISADRQQMRSRGGMALASTPVSRHGGNPGAVTNAREATKLAQQLAKDLQITGIQCVEALVEWMLEAGAQAETPPPFLWRGRNYFLKMFSDLDFAETELQARGVNLDCFKQTNPLLIKPNQKLGRVLAAHSIIMEMVEFAKDMTPMELLTLSGRMRDSSREERQTSSAKAQGQTNLSTELAEMADNDGSDIQTHRSKPEEEIIGRKQEIEHHDHESAADLVNLLDESFDFMRGNASCESNTNPTEPSSDNDYDDESNKSEERVVSIIHLPNADKASEDDCPANKLEEEEEAQGVPTDNQSDYEENSMDDDQNADNQSNVEATASQSDLSLPKLPPDDTDENDEPEVVCNNLTADEGLSEQETLANTIDPEPGNNLPSARTKVSDNQSDYDNSFDAEAGDDDSKRKLEANAKQGQLQGTPENLESSEAGKAAEPNESTEVEDAADVQNSRMDLPASPDELSVIRAEEEDGSDYENSFDEEAEEDTEKDDSDPGNVFDSAIESDATTTASGVPPILGMQLSQHVLEAEIDEPVQETDDAQTISKRLVDELKRWTFLEDENRPTEVSARGCLSWCSARLITEALESHSSITESMVGSITSMLEQYGLAIPESPLESLLCSEVAQELDLATHLTKECEYLLDDISSAVAAAMQRSLESKNSLVSEIEIEEVLEIAEGVRQEYHDSTWEYLKTASSLLIFLQSSKKEILAQLKRQSPASAGLSRLVKVFYPYLVNQPREELRDNWHPVSSILAAMGLPVDRIYHILDPMCKTLLLAVELCNRSNQDSQDEDDFAVFPKVTVVCDREDVLHSSVEYIWQNHLSSDKVASNFLLFPFFKSSFGEKLVDGVKVEEGEGKGPLKEWFRLVATKLTSKWRQIPVCKLSLEAQATANGNAITVPGAANVIQPGFRLEWETSDGETISRVVNKSEGDGTFLMDRSVSSQSFSVSQLGISQPSPATFEYVQASESYWLNEHMSDSPETRNALTFVGWFLASAVTHFSATQLRIHPLFFRLLLNPRHIVTLEEMSLFDSELFNSLTKMKDMKPSDFAEYLRFEGADESLSVEAYIDKVLDEKFGSVSGIAWQIDVIRHGFTRVITIDQLDRVGIADVDLAESVCGTIWSHDDDFDINDVFRVAADTDFTNCQPLAYAFWQTVNSFEPQLKRKFIKFVTGVDTLPLSGTEFLRIEMPFTAISAADHEKCLQMLPQAHTCDNRLELPHYWKSLCWREQLDEDGPSATLEEELGLLLRKKLQDAVEYSSGYGLDGTAAVAGVLEGNDDSEQLANEESYDSLGLPALSEGNHVADLPTESSQPSPQVPGLEEAEQDDETEDAPVAPTAVVSPRPDESYDEYDWEEEEQSVS